jgi:hypothetical protein
MQRADTGAYETAQTGVEYIAPDAFQHGGIYGTVYRQYFSGTTGTLSNATYPGPASETAVTITDIANLRGGQLIVTNAGGADIQGGVPLTATTWVNPPWLDATTNIKINWGLDLDTGKAYSGWIDYTK